MKNLISILLLLFTTSTYGQYFTKFSFKSGFTFSNQIKKPKIIDDDGIKFGLSETIEPTIITFGTKKQFDFNTDISYIQKGDHNYSPIGDIGSASYLVTINYISFSPIIKVSFWKIFFIKAGPRIDIFTSFKNNFKPDLYFPSSPDPRTNKDFNAFTYGITYGFGICTGKNRVKFICELTGQNDFSKSSYNKASGQTFINNCYLLNFGVTVMLHKVANLQP